MEEHKLKRIESIQQEVRDFHPLLKLLLPKLPGVKSCEYTHGTNEMGADFLVGQLSTTFSQMDYISVVAKVGKLDQSNFDELYKQVKESFVSKLVHSGKHRLYVGEVWVVTTGSISHGVKERINEECRGTKITFVTGDALVELITKHLPNYWTDVPLALGDYLHELHTKNEEIDRSLSLLKTHKEFYIHQDIYTVPSNSYETRRDKVQKPHRVDLYDIIANNRVVLLEGDMGSGKSKLLRQLIRHYTHPQTYLDTSVVPILLTYRTLVDDFSSSCTTALKSLLPQDTLAELPKDVTFLFLLDAVDEKNLTADEQLQTLTHVVDLIRENVHIKAVITSRYLGCLEKSQSRLPVCERLEMHPLSASFLIESIQELCSEVNLANRIFEDLRKSPLMKELPRSPIAAILLANLLTEQAKELPSTLPELYSKYLELILGRWDMEKGLQTQKEYDTLSAVMMLLAKHVLENELAFVSISEVRSIFGQYLTPRNLGVSVDRLLSIVRDRCGIVVVNDTDGRVFFKHRTFAEFLYAQHCLKHRTLKVDNRAFRFYWLNTFYFYIGLLRDCPELLEEIAGLAPVGESERLIRLLNMGNFLMAAYTSPYNIISKILTQVVVDTAEYYVKILRHEIDTPLSQFSPMHLLWIFQAVVRESYSYEFFLKSLETAAIDVKLRTLDEDTKAYALFFLNVAYVDAGGRDSFDFILEGHLKVLPFSVQLAIGHETEERKTRSALVRHARKTLHKALHGNKLLQDQLAMLYERPIRSLKGK